MVNKIVDQVVKFIPILLSIIGFMALYPGLFVCIAISIGGFYRRNYLEGLGYLLLSLTLYFLGKGIGRYLEINEKEE